MNMNCPNCGAHLSFKTKICDRCSADVTTYRRLWSISNKYYNDALEKAKIRDLSGAIVSLKNSLQIDKTNTNARNLLGLIYHEMGEIVYALSEWVISKNYQENDNIADYYMNLVQNNQSKLHNVNQIIKKYNYALSQAQSGNLDVALIQLKKVVSMQPNYLVAHQLLALLYMQHGENEKAAKSLRKAQKIDINNTITLRYLAELGLNPNAVRIDKEMKKLQSKGKALEKAEEPKFFSPEPTLRDGKINKLSFLYLVIGIVVGVLAVFFLVVPTMKKSISAEFNSQAVAMGEEQTSMASEIQTLESEKEDLNDTIAELKKKMKKIEDEAVDESVYDNLFDGITLYANGDKDAAAETLIKVDISALESKPAKELYNKIKEETFEAMSTKKYVEGSGYYNRGNYDEAVKSFELALKYNENNANAMYYLGRVYQRNGDNKNAKKYYKKIINEYPNDPRYGDASRRLEEITAAE